MCWNSPRLAEAEKPSAANSEGHKRAYHAGWLAGVAMRLGCGSLARNPYERDSEEYLHWNMGFDSGFAG